MCKGRRNRKKKGGKRGPGTRGTFLIGVHLFGGRWGFSEITLRPYLGAWVRYIEVRFSLHRVMLHVEENHGCHVLMMHDVVKYDIFEFRALCDATAELCLKGVCL